MRKFLGLVLLFASAATTIQIISRNPRSDLRCVMKIQSDQCVTTPTFLTWENFTLTHTLVSAPGSIRMLRPG